MAKERVKIGLVDYDSLFKLEFAGEVPKLNILLMKAATYYKNQDCIVELVIKPQDMNYCDAILLFKNTHDDTFMPKLMTKDNITVIGKSFNANDTPLIEEEIFECEPDILIYNRLFQKIKAVDKAITIPRIQQWRKIKHIQPFNGEQEDNINLSEGDVVQLHGQFFSNPKCMEMLKKIFATKHRFIVNEPQLIKSERGLLEAAQLARFMRANLRGHKKKIEILFIMETDSILKLTTKYKDFLKDNQDIFFYKFWCKQKGNFLNDEEKMQLIKELIIINRSLIRKEIIHAFHIMADLDAAETAIVEILSGNTWQKLAVEGKMSFEKFLKKSFYYKKEIKVFFQKKFLKNIENELAYTGL